MHKKIGIDARFYGEAGPGRYVKNILWGLEKIDSENIYYVFLRKAGFDKYPQTADNFVKVLADYKWYSWGEQIGFLYTVLKYKLDLFYVPHFNIPVLYPFKMITAIPDLIMHGYSTEKGTTLPKPYFKFKKIVYRLVVLWAVLRSVKVIVPSKDVAEDFKSEFPGVDKNKFVIAYEGVDPVFLDESKNDPVKVVESYNIKLPYVLYISSMYEHKNVPGLIAAYKILLEDYKVDFSLVLIGKKDKYSEEVGRMITNEGLEKSVFIPGLKAPVGDKDTIAFRKLALVYVFPSFKEGFSLTPMEAQVYGIPCTISDIPVHREVYGDSVTYFDPYDPRDIAEKIYKLAGDRDLRITLSARGSELYKKYSWTNTAKISLEQFNSALAK